MSDRVEALWAFLARPVPGGPEVVVSVQSGPNPGDISPLIAHDPEVMDALVEIAQGLATQSGVEVRCVKFVPTDDVRVFEPGVAANVDVIEGKVVEPPGA